MLHSQKKSEKKLSKQISKGMGLKILFQSEEVKEKIMQTNLERYGVEYPSQSEEVQEKVRQTNLERYGVENPSQSEEVKEKKKQTNLERRGVEHPSQNPEIFSKMRKSAFRFKDYEFPSRKIRQVQGYEPFALNELVQQYDELDIVTGDEVPNFTYISEDGKEHTYFPDIYIKPDNLIIEVKSDYTLKLVTNKIILQAKSVEDEGYMFEVWVYTTKGEKTVFRGANELENFFANLE